MTPALLGATVVSHKVLKGFDKQLHFLSFLGLAFLLALSVSQHRTLRFRGILFLFCIVSGYGVLDELSQTFVEGRTPDIWDATADVCGAAFGLLLFAGLNQAIHFLTRGEELQSAA